MTSNVYLSQAFQADHIRLEGTCRKQCYGGDAVTLYHISVITSAGFTPLPDVGRLNVMVLWYLLT